MLFHPGRQDGPSATDEQRTLTSLPEDYMTVAARKVQEESRWRVVAEIRRFAVWTALTPTLNPQSPPDHTVLQFVHQLARSLIRHPDKRRRVTRPSTVATWIRRLESALPTTALSRSRTIAAYLTGIRSLAPGLSPYVHRDQQALWDQAVDLAYAAATTSDRTALAAALWLALYLQRLGFRPMASVRAALPQGVRRRSPVQVGPGVQAHAWTVEVLIDKDNATGAVAAPRRRWIPSTAAIDTLMARLPIAYGAPAQMLVQRRRALLRSVGITQTYVARRDAAATAEARGLAVGSLLNHRPGSKATPGYVATTTATSLLQALWQSET